MRILAIDTATQSLSVALIEDKKLVMETTTNTRIQHSKQLLPIIDQLFTTVGWQPEDLEQIIVTKGPGSYTGLRIGVTVAKTLASTLQIPLYTVSSLQALAANVKTTEPIFILPFINARRQTVFAGAYIKTGNNWQEVLPIRHQKFADWTRAVKDLMVKTAVKKHVLISPDTENFTEEITQEFPEISVQTAIIRAIDMVSLPLEAVDVDTFIPEYAKLAEAEENWRSQNPNKIKEDESYVERTD